MEKEMIDEWERSWKEAIKACSVEVTDEDLESPDTVYMTCQHCGYEWSYILYYGFRDPDDKICPKCGKK